MDMLRFRKGGSMRFLYIAPRYHTNQMDIMQDLTDHGDQVCFISHYAAIIEDYSCVEPVVLGYSPLYRAFDYLYMHVLHRKNPEAVVYKIQHGFPPIGRLKKLIYEYQPDIVILREKSMYSIVAYLICKKRGYPCILYNQTPLWSEPVKTDPAHRLVDCLTPKLRMTPVAGVQKPGTSIKPNDYFVPFVVNPRKSPEERGYFAEGMIHILCIGKYEIRKHHLMMMEVAEELSKRYRLHLTLIGEATTAFQKGYYQEVLDYRKEHQLEQLVTVRKNVPRSHMEEEYLRADLFVIPSTREMASISQLEAMSYSLPVICSDTNGTACYVENGVSGYLFRDCDREDLQEKVECMLSDTDRMRAMGAAGYRALQERYHFGKYYETIMQMAERIRNGK